MSDGSPVGRYLTSGKNIAGMAGGLVGVGLHLAGVVGDVWPVVAAGLYGVAALVTPPDRTAPPRLTDELRAEVDGLRRRISTRPVPLPPGLAVHRLRGALDGLRLVLDRLDEVSEDAARRAAAPEQLAVAAGIVRHDLPACLDAYRDRPPPVPEERAAAELLAQLDVVAAAVDRLAAQLPDARAGRSAELTRDLRRRHGSP
jgi:hypothetical protein